ncbi:hypothetical protein ACSIGC_17960 (plasmid) [Tenacibaculum sp. ZS6-P6]|uniref:hypothetical protein n=1 Tax=Tenacibaculum sp. ZS6-P6 TaxID=3447503 RepID=UPI003F98FCF6
MEVGTNNGVVTDFDGNFQIEDFLLNRRFLSVLLVLKRKRLRQLRRPVEVTLESDAAALDEVVVVGYGNRKQRDLTGAGFLD